MRIGIDARPLSRQLTGIGYYTFEVIKALDHCEITTILFSPAPLRVELKQLKHCEVISRNHTSLIAKQLWSELYLPFLLRQYALDLFWGPSHRLPSFLPKNLASVVTIHDLIWKKASKTMRKSTWFLEALLMPKSIRRADLILTDSLATEDDLKREYPHCHDKIRHVPLGNRGACISDPSDPAPLSTPYVLFVGTIEPRKNLNRLLSAYASLSSSLKNRFKLVIAGGSGWGNIDLHQQITQLKLQDNVLIKPYPSTHELFALYQHATCLVMPSLYEGFGLPILEAQGFGIPVITSNVSSMPEVAGDGALLVDPLSINSIQEALEKLLTNTAYRKILSVKARENASKYSWGKTAQLTIQTFQEAKQKKDHPTYAH